MARGKQPRKPVWADIEFSPEEMKYNQDEFFVPSHDSNGHSLREWVRFMPQMVGELELLVQSAGKLVGYQTKGDLIRHAVARHIEWLHRLEPSMPRTYLGAIQAQSLILGEDRHKCATEQVFRELFERVEHHLQAGDQGEAVRQMALVKAAMDNTAETPWKRRWLSRFRRQYSAWLNPAVNVSMEVPQMIAAAETVDVDIEPLPIRPQPGDEDGAPSDDPEENN